MANNNNGKRKSLKKDRIIRRIVFAVCASLVIAAALFTASHSICYKYNDWWIKGNSIENVKEKYGTSNLFQDQISEPRNENTTKVYYYSFEGYLDHGIIDYEPYDSYVMEVDSDGIVIDVYYERCLRCGL